MPDFEMPAHDALRGKTAIVTGAGGERGRDIALALARLGADIVVADTIRDGGVRTAQCITALGRRALFVPTDIAEESSIYGLTVEAIKGFGTVDILVNNAVLAPPGGIGETDRALWDRVMAVNLRGPFLLFQALRSSLGEGDGGVVVNILSEPDAAGKGCGVAYGVSRAGLAFLTTAMASEVGDGAIRVCGLRAGSEAAGAATARLVVGADEYHGELVSGRELSARPAREEASMTKNALGDPPLIPEGLEKAVQGLVGAVARMEEGYNRLPLLVRSLAAGILQKKTGLTLPEWRAWVAEMGKAARGIGRTEPEERAARIRVLLAREDRDRALAGLAGCVRSLPEHAVRFTRDPALLEELAREAVVQERRILRARRVLRHLADN